MGFLIGQKQHHMLIQAQNIHYITSAFKNWQYTHTRSYKQNVRLVFNGVQYKTMTRAKENN